MKIGFIGLGKMGLNLSLNMLEKNHEVIGYDLDKKAREKAHNEGLEVVDSLEVLIDKLDNQKILYVMVPSGEPTESTLTQLSELLKNKENTIVVDGGNTFYKDTLKHSKMFEKNNIKFLDVGTSGGVDGARQGACLMIGGDKEAYETLRNLFIDITVENGHLYTGEPGSGHYLKMIHNGIEYGMMQAIGEGFEILEASKFDYNFQEVSKVWNHGSVIRSWLMELAEEAFSQDPTLKDITGEVDSSGEGQWTVESALENRVPAPVITASVYARYRSKQKDTFTGKVVASLRNGFGGHQVYEK